VFIFQVIVEKINNRVKYVTIIGLFLYTTYLHTQLLYSQIMTKSLY